MNMELIIVVGIIVIGLVLHSLIRGYLNLRLRMIELEEQTLSLSVSYSLKDVKELIQEFIVDCINEYLIKNNIQDGSFINSEIEIEMRQYVSMTLSARLSRSIYKKIEFVLSERSIADFIAENIVSTVSIFVANNNKAKTK